MKTKVFIGIGLALFMVFLGFGNYLREKNLKEHAGELKSKEMKARAARIQYFEDERTGLCFAYLWEGGDKGGPTLTLVPRENVAHLLTK